MGKGFALLCRLVGKGYPLNFAFLPLFSSFQKVHWSVDTIDNENMNKMKSKSESEFCSPGSPRLRHPAILPYPEGPTAAAAGLPSLLPLFLFPLRTQRRNPSGAAASTHIPHRPVHLSAHPSTPRLIRSPPGHPSPCPPCPLPLKAPGRRAGLAVQAVKRRGPLLLSNTRKTHPLTCTYLSPLFLSFPPSLLPHPGSLMGLCSGPTVSADPPEYLPYASHPFLNPTDKSPPILPCPPPPSPPCFCLCLLLRCRRCCCC